MISLSLEFGIRAGSHKATLPLKGDAFQSDTSSGKVTLSGSKVTHSARKATLFARKATLFAATPATLSQVSTPRPGPCR
jgi:hypothetical protein